MVNYRQKSVQFQNEADPRIKKAREWEIKLKDARQHLKDHKYEMATLELNLRGSLVDFYPMTTASEKLNTTPISVVKMIRNGRIFGVQVDGRWYAEREDIDIEAERVG